MNRVTIALGSNLGERCRFISEAKNHLRALLDSPEALFLEAHLYETPPVDCPPDSDAFLNTVVSFDWAGTAEELLIHMQAIENTLGRPAEHGVNAPRTVDLDIITFGDQVIHTKSLEVPHPRAHLREFVLRPLADIQPDLSIPGQTLTVAELLKQLGSTDAKRFI